MRNFKYFDDGPSNDTGADLWTLQNKLYDKWTSLYSKHVYLFEKKKGGMVYGLKKNKIYIQKENFSDIAINREPESSA